MSLHEVKNELRPPVCHIHGVSMIDIRGAGHMHPDGSEHGIFTYGCPHIDYWDYKKGQAVRCGVEKTITIKCPEDARA